MDLKKIWASVLPACIQFKRPATSNSSVCRLLLVESPKGIDPNPLLEKFAEMCQNSREFQGHGWGCSWLDQNREWKIYHHLDPVWQRPRQSFPETRLFLVHARSAFRDEGIVIENNMPFSDGTTVFLFNGELRGVRVKAPGRIGAEKIYNYIRRFDHGDLAEATVKAVDIINKRSRYIRAMNFFIARPDAVQICSWFNEDPDYFQLRKATDGDTRIICSAPLPDFAPSWDTIENKSFETIPIQ